MAINRVTTKNEVFILRNYRVYVACLNDAHIPEGNICL